MQVEGNKERLRTQISALRSGNKRSIMEALALIRENSSVSILEELFQLLLTQDDEEIIQFVTALLNDLKLQEAAPVLATAIDDGAYADIQHILVAACWQNGLSYAGQTDTFVRVLLHGSYAAAIEAFTVLEEAAGELETKESEELANQLKADLASCAEDRKALLGELVKIIARFDNPTSFRLAD